MVESLMLIALGFLTATLFAIVAAQFVWRRAVTVTTQKLRSEFNLDDLEQTSARLSDAEAALGEKQNEIADLAAHADALANRNAELEHMVSSARAETQALHDEIGELRTHYEAARAEAEQHVQEIAALHAHSTTLQSTISELRERIGHLESAAVAEIERQKTVGDQLKDLGDRASRLIAEMNLAFGQAGEAQPLQAAIAPAPEEPAAPAPLAPYPTDEHHDLEAIKASLSDPDESEAGESEEHQDEEREAPLPSEAFLAERIRALEAGVAS